MDRHTRILAARPRRLCGRKLARSARWVEAREFRPVASSRDHGPTDFARACAPVLLPRCFLPQLDAPHRGVPPALRKPLRLGPLPQWRGEQLGSPPHTSAPRYRPACLQDRSAERRDRRVFTRADRLGVADLEGRTTRSRSSSRRSGGVRTCPPRIGMRPCPRAARSG